jgi:hypothetical protein
MGVYVLSRLANVKDKVLTPFAYLKDKVLTPFAAPPLLPTPHGLLSRMARG